ncbi:hypothetical protein ZOSMA_156G00180 [Zostera marina]|uniref:At3g05675-like ankyrin-like domain-containing protein n=1 Tax=Zostera marina TaxID=29655 RepID=A0A0K9PXK5_ZOSMR|nr:hypothetical protein ZOSMA_156G00180 [Zostera marina]
MEEKTEATISVKNPLYISFETCLSLLGRYMTSAANSTLIEVTQIARQADNLHWILDILINRQIADEFLSTWSAQTQLSVIHTKVPSIDMYEISRITTIGLFLF